MTQQPYNYSISTDKSKLNFNVIYNFIANSYWAKGIPKSVMQKAIDNSMCFGVYSPNNEQVGFARVESPRVHRRPVCLSQATLPDSFKLS